jgi:hypothetical protein
MKRYLEVSIDLQVSKTVPDQLDWPPHTYVVSQNHSHGTETIVETGVGAYASSINQSDRSRTARGGSSEKKRIQSVIES